MNNDRVYYAVLSFGKHFLKKISRVSGLNLRLQLTVSILSVPVECADNALFQCVTIVGIVNTLFNACRHQPLYIGHDIHLQT